MEIGSFEMCSMPLESLEGFVIVTDLCSSGNVV